MSYARHGSNRGSAPGRSTASKAEPAGFDASATRRMPCTGCGARPHARYACCPDCDHPASDYIDDMLARLEEGAPAPVQTRLMCLCNHSKLLHEHDGPGPRCRGASPLMGNCNCPYFVEDEMRTAIVKSYDGYGTISPHSAGNAMDDIGSTTFRAVARATLF